VSQFLVLAATVMALGLIIVVPFAYLVRWLDRKRAAQANLDDDKRCPDRLMGIYTGAMPREGQFRPRRWEGQFRRPRPTSDQIGPHYLE
jgi:hypothetical protein